MKSIEQLKKEIHQAIDELDEEKDKKFIKELIDLIKLSQKNNKK